MKRTFAVLLMTVTFACTAQSQETSPEDVNQALLEEIRQMRVALQQIAEDVAKIREDQSHPPALDSSWMDSTGFVSRHADIQKLAAIKMPNLSDKEQVKQYIFNILSASQGQNCWSSQDPQVAMLTKLGPENVPALIDALTLASGINDYHLRYAINRLADEDSKPLILAALPQYRNLVEAVINNGWENDARQILIDGISNPYEDLPTEWITAVVNLNDPTTYPLLREHFIQGRNHYWIYQEIEGLPIEDLPGAVAEAWEDSKHNNNGCGHEYMAMAAMSYGHLDALSEIIDMLASNDPDNQWMLRQSRAKLFDVLDFRGSNSDLIQWYADHRDQLRFDPELKKFVVSEQAPDAP